MKSPLYKGCMLAGHSEEVPTDGFPLAVQPKHDGFRLLARIEVEGVYLMVRDGESNPYDANLRHIAEDIASLGIEPGTWLDGELHGASWNETASYARLKSPGSAEREIIRERLKMHVFDIFHDRDLEQRLMPRARLPRTVVKQTHKFRREELVIVFGAGAVLHNDSLRLVDERLAYTYAEALALFDECLANGYEGAMFKRLDAPYVLDRDDAWLAVKPAKTIDGTVLRVVEGGGKHAGRMGALHCKTAEGQEFSVGTGFSDADREDVWANRAELVGRWVEVKVQANTKTSDFRHPSFVRWRDDRLPADPGHKADARTGVPLGEAQQLAQFVKDELENLGYRHVAVAGSVRRLKAAVGDIDLLAMAPEAGQPIDELKSVGWAGGPSRWRWQVEGVHVDLMIVEEQAALGAALMHLTGPKERNISQRAKAMQLGLTLNEKGLWEAGKRIAGATEREVYNALVMELLPPEKR